MSFTPVQIFSALEPSQPPIVEGATFAPDTEYGNGLWVATVTDAGAAAALTGVPFFSREEIEELRAIADAITAQRATLASASSALDSAIAATVAAEVIDYAANADVVAALATKTAADAAYAAAFATGTLTSDGTAPADADTVTLGAKTYTFKTALTPAEGEVLIGSTVDASAALANLKSAVNHTGTPDTDYSCAAAHPTITAGVLTGTTLVFTAKTAGAAGELASTETSTHLSFGGPTLLRDAGLASAASAADSAYTSAVATASTDLGTRDTDRTAQAAAAKTYAQEQATLNALLLIYLKGSRVAGKVNPFPI